MSGAKTRKINMFSVYMSEKSVKRVAAILRSGFIGEGAAVREFERLLTDIAHASYPVALNSATSALHLALVMAGVKSGDEVITTAQTMMAPAHAILYQSAKPVFADVQYLTGNIDPKDIERRVTERTRAVLVVHWGGYPCDMDEIHAVARKYSLAVIEDAAHALGATYRGKPIGSISGYTCFSFQAIKHVTCGDGGALCLLNEKDYHQARRRRWYGIDRDNRKPSILGEPIWNVTEVGYKYHMNDIAASIGIENLKLLPEILNRRRKTADYYREQLQDVPGITLFEKKSDRVGANWIFTMHVQNREGFAKMMRSKGVEASIVHLRIDRNDIFGPVRQDLPALDRLTKTHISLPLHMGLTDEDIAYVVKCIKEGW